MLKVIDRGADADTTNAGVDTAVLSASLGVAIHRGDRDANADPDPSPDPGNAA